MSKVVVEKLYCYGYVVDVIWKIFIVCYSIDESICCYVRWDKNSIIICVLL